MSKQLFDLTNKTALITGSSQGIGFALARGPASAGVVMQLGLGGDMMIAMQTITVKELDLRGSFRFHEEFGMAVSLMQQGIIDVKPLLSHTVSFEDAARGFELANDRSQAMKTQIRFSWVNFSSSLRFVARSRRFFNQPNVLSPHHTKQTTSRKLTLWRLDFQSLSASRCSRLH
ncbi:L-idonate 5-dehydrogenase (NAD(P)(+)) [Planctomycetes bacterium CA13]|uniref:L-idonate 5-dehydrogenase (NAD(P)(+)) n=1 Tax=Novipirellula herctigrandis TaxID=2527986 RepID=A0A5C5Z0Z5_9BACT|nr:L-idonate 5-dehydrogenase (NAD(P)(+)) [Planctomycetes bacterium CA13]